MNMYLKLRTFADDNDMELAYKYDMVNSKHIFTFKRPNDNQVYEYVIHDYEITGRREDGEKAVFIINDLKEKLSIM